MSRRNKILIILISVSSLILLFLGMYVFNVYGDIIKKNPQNLFTDQSSTIKIEVVPINAFGWEIPFRNSKTEFKIIEGEDLIEILNEDNRRGILILRSKGMIGNVEVSVKSQFSLFPTLVSIEILTLTG